MKNKTPKIGQRIKFEDGNPNTKEPRILEGTIVKVSADFGGIAYVGNVTSKDEFIIHFKNIL